MNVTILEKSAIKYKGRFLTPLCTYHDIDEQTAAELIASGDAKEANEKIPAVSIAIESRVPKTGQFDPKANGGYVGKAKLTAEQERELEEKGKAKNAKGEEIEKDDTPVTGKDSTRKPDVETPKVDAEEVEVKDDSGKVLSAEEIAERERAAAAAAPVDVIPTAAEANASGEVVS